MLDCFLAKVQKQLYGKGYPFQQMVPEQLDIYRQKMNLNLNLKPYPNINSKSITDLTVKQTNKRNTIKCSEEKKTGENLQIWG